MSRGGNLGEVEEEKRKYYSQRIKSFPQILVEISAKDQWRKLHVPASTLSTCQSLSGISDAPPPRQGEGIRGDNELLEKHG